jgi:predicted membrane GTPase involved in stress response
VVDQTFDLFDNLGATDEQLDFPIIYASALNGFAGLEEDVSGGDMTPLFQTIIDKVTPPPVDVDAPFQMQVISLDYNSYVGVIGVGRIQRGTVKRNQPLTLVDDAFLVTKRVCGIGPSTASTNNNTESTIDKTRSTSPPKSACPGVSTILM